MPSDPTTSHDLKDACVVAAHAVIVEHGIEKLSLRDVARKLNVSHQAPYKHYPSRDHLLAEVIRRCFKQFALTLDSRTRHAVPLDDLHSLGHSYLRYALEHPLEYRLMFGTPWPNVEADAGLLVDARHAFGVLQAALEPLYAGQGISHETQEADALFIWSSMHGLATILQSQVMNHLALSEAVRTGAVQHVMQMVDSALLQRLGAARHLHN
ncbi:MAG: TetR/AcrR family transcriptional regulator [Burkholderiales bacterium]